jgi:hypothetical protein
MGMESAIKKDQSLALRPRSLASMVSVARGLTLLDNAAFVRPRPVNVLTNLGVWFGWIVSGY